MITTEEYKDIPATIVHRLSDTIASEDVEKGIDEAVEIFHAMGKKYRELNLIINTKGLLFADLKAHKTWSRWLKTSSAIKERVNFVIFVTDDSPNARVDKKAMETDKRKFFVDLDEGVNWLKYKLAW